MELRPLGQTSLKVSALCLGTMTWGEQNSEREAHQQLDLAASWGVNFIDAAELYPVPPRAETYGRTEEILGTWLRHQVRDQFIIASKVAGPQRNNDNLSYMRGGARLTRAQILAACEASLRRLQTDYLDLYQLHWPERPSNFFGRLGLCELGTAPDAVPLEESLAALAELQQAGKIRHFGLSNETAWGVMHSLRCAEKAGFAAPVSVQNPYNLLNRSFEVGLSEVALREQVGLLAYSPLAFGVLSGKYRQKPWPEAARLTRFQRFQRYSSPLAFAAVERYAQIAEAAGLPLAQMALAFVTGRAFVTSNIIGATTLEQLRENLASSTMVLSEDTLTAIDAVHREISNPCP